MKTWRQPNEREKAISLQEIQNSMKLSEQSLADELGHVIERMVRDGLIELKALVRGKKDPNELRIRHGAEYANIVSAAYKKAIQNGNSIASRDLNIASSDLPRLEKYTDSIGRLYSDKSCADLKFVLLANFYRRIAVKEITAE